MIKIIRRSQTSGKPVKCRNSLRIDIFRKNWSEKDGRSFFLFATLSKIPLHMKLLKICQTNGAYFRRRWYAVYDDKLTQAACLIDGYRKRWYATTKNRFVKCFCLACCDAIVFCDKPLLSPPYIGVIVAKAFIGQEFLSVLEMSAMIKSQSPNQGH